MGNEAGADKTPIYQSMGKTGNNIQLLHDSLDALISRIEPVCKPGELQGGVLNDPKEAQAKSPVREEIDQIGDGIGYAVQRIQSIISALEI